MPEPFLTTLPSTNDGPESTMSTPSWLLQQLPKIWRLTEQFFILPFNLYLDIIEQEDTALRLKKLYAEFFKQKVTDDAAILVDDKSRVDPQVLDDLITTQVSQATKKLSSEVTRLKKALEKQTKNSPRDNSRSTRKSKK